MKPIELNQGKCKTYLVSCPDTGSAMLIDPVAGNADRYLAMLAYRGLTLEWLVDTHTHADHPSGTALMHALTGATIVMHERAPTPIVGRHVKDGEQLAAGKLKFTVLYTPGHTPDSISLYGHGYVFTGDVLLIHGTGRADFAGGDAGDQYDAITGKLFVLPDDTVVLPGHDYRGNTQSTIGQEKQHNPRVAGKTRDEYVALMDSIEFPLPDKIQEVLQPNQSAIDDEKMPFPSLSQLSDVQQLRPAQVRERLQAGAGLIDVREAEEFNGELGHIEGARLVPLKELVQAASDLDKQRPWILICRSGVRSTTAAAMLTALGFDEVYNLRGGMLDWQSEA
ncbi:MAG: MBL fold metallo-hydrolase [Gammaproteobacteria bacterium]|nr:MBL fold metallo-hydrolase [Gammaproteobacteria bacterium]